MLKSIFALFAKLRPEALAAQLELPNQNDAFNGLAHSFIHDSEKPILGSQHLISNKLDFSMNSLDHVNDYLDIIRKDSAIEENWNVVVLRAGAYVGEVIKSNDRKNSWIWIDADQAAKINPKFEVFGKSIGNVALLYDRKEGCIFPLAKVEKFLTNGREDDVQFFAQVILSHPMGNLAS